MILHISLLSVLRMSEKILPALYLHKEEVMQQFLSYATVFSLFSLCHVVW